MLRISLNLMKSKFCVSKISFISTFYTIHSTLRKRVLNLIKRFFYRIFCGFFLGVSVFAPGFSGSIIAIIMGIYKDIVRIMSNPFKQFKENVKFVFPLGIGGVISLVLFLISFKYLFDTYKQATYFLFVGLIAGNLPVIYDEIKKSVFRKRYLIGSVAAFAAALALSIFSAGQTEAEGIPSLIIMALGGLGAGVTALMPGMSVSMVLIIMGVYKPLFDMANAFLRMEFMPFLVPVGVFGVCALAGLVLTSKGIKAVFERFPGLANSMIFGFMTGSLIGILMESIQEGNSDWLVGGVMLVIGLAVSMLFVVLGKVMNKEEA